MQHFSRILSVATMAAAMSACGGGDDGPAAPEAADKYVGEWVGQCEFVTGNSGETLLLKANFIKSSATAIRGTLKEIKFAANDCTGAIRNEKATQLVFALQGTKVVGADTVDKVLGGLDGDPPEKSIMLVKGNAIFVSDLNAPLDSEGFPNAIDPIEFLTKVP